MLLYVNFCFMSGTLAYWHSSGIAVAYNSWETCIASNFWPTIFFPRDFHTSNMRTDVKNRIRANYCKVF